MKKSLWAGIAAVAVLGAAAVYRYAPGHVTAAGEGAPPPAAAGASAAAPGGGPVSVTTVKAQRRDFNVQIEATGTVMAASSVDIRPQVSSVIRNVHVREGQFVKAGDLLFTLDTRTDAANVARARAQLNRDQATLADVQRQLARSRDLFAQKFVSQAAVDSNLAQVEAQTALVASDQVAIEAAKVGLGYGRISAPSGGRVGAVAVYAGSSVQANLTTLLTITQLDPIFVGFNLPQRNVGDALRSLRDGGSAVHATLPESKSSLQGRLQFVDNAVDAASGTVKVKAVFDNRDQALWPGAFVNVLMSVQTIKDAVVVPQAAIVQTPRGRTVFVVEAGNKAAARPVELLQSAGTEAVVNGVRAGESVVVDGRQNLRPGSTVVERAAGAGAGGPGRRAAASGGASGGATAAAPGASGGSPGNGGTQP